MCYIFKFLSSIDTSYKICKVFIISVFVIFTNLNSDLIALDLFFAKLSGFTKGFAIMVALLIGAIVSFFFQLPILIRKNKKIIEGDDSSKA